MAKDSLKGKSFDSGTLSKISAAIGDKNLSKKVTDLGGKVTSGGGGSTSPTFNTATGPQTQEQFINQLASMGILKNNTTSGITEANRVATANYNPATGLYDKLTGPVNVADLTTPITPIPTVPQPKLETPPMPQITPVATVSAEETLRKEREQTNADLLKSYADLETPSLEAERIKMERQAGIEKKQKVVNDLTSQLNTIVAQQQADILAARNQSSAEGGTAGILSAREDAINRSAAIKALPIQALLASAQQDLETANERLNTLFDLRSKDIENKYNRDLKVIETNYNFATAEQKIKLDDLREVKKQAYDKNQGNTEYLRSLSAKFLEDNPILSSKLMGIDPESATFDADVAKVLKNYGGTTTTGTSTKAQSWANLINSGKATLSDVPATLKTQVASALSSGTTTTISEKDLGVVNDINNIIADPAFESTFGLTSVINRSIAGTPAYALSANVNNLINKLALAARGELKGQGAVSDFEGKMLREAQTALKLNMNPEQAKKELIKVKGAIMTSSGGSATVKITAKDGSSKIGQADQKTIMEAINGGYTVTYQ
jgi:hypothetical protein